MNTIDAVMLIMSIILTVYSTVMLVTKDSGRALSGFTLALSINTIVDIVIKSLVQ